MDLSALIFVALAVAWAAYLVPKALRQHDDSDRNRSVDTFSDDLRVLDLRVPEAPAADDERDERPQRRTLTPAQARVRMRARREAAALAARRRRRVVLLILLSAVAVGVLAQQGHLAWPDLGFPAGVLVGWLVLCRVMVRAERRHREADRLPIIVEPLADSDDDATAEQSAVAEPPEITDPPAPGGWDPVPVTLPTYVDKAPAARSVRTIDLDSTGVWSSGRSAADSQLARDAEQTRTRETPTPRRATGT